MTPSDTPAPPKPAKPGQPCPQCSSTNTKQTEIYEDAYGHLVTEHLCNDCKHEFQKKIGGL